MSKLPKMNSVVRFERMVHGSGQKADGSGPFAGFARYEMMVPFEELAVPPSMGMAYDFFGEDVQPIRLVAANIITRIGEMPSDEEIMKAAEEGVINHVLIDVFLHAEQAGNEGHFRSICQVAEKSGWHCLEKRSQ